MDIKKKTNQLELIRCLIFTLVHFSAHGSEIDCFMVLKEEKDLSAPLWTETHCAKTAQNIIKLCEKKGIIIKDGDASDDLPTFFNTPMAEKLLSYQSHQNIDFFL